VTAARETPITELTIARDVPARMRDGVVLRANVYRPAIAGPWPTLLTRTPYGKDLPGAAAWLDPVRAAGAGFIVIVQDVRGRFASDGDWEPFLHESSDGFDTVQWAARLPGGNGRVGILGQHAVVGGDRPAPIAVRDRSRADVVRSRRRAAAPRRRAAVRHGRGVGPRAGHRLPAAPPGGTGAGRRTHP
jgi:hypothetical protein